MQVTLIESHGDEAFISRIAGLSHESQKGPSVAQLLQWGHLSPLEFAGVTYLVKCPIFVARQIMRHRTASYLEKSLRYCTLDEMVCDLPQELIDNPATGSTLSRAFRAYRDIVEQGEELIGEDTPPSEKKVIRGRYNELARSVLPLSLETSFYVQFDLRNLLHLFEMRLADDAQRETRHVATAMLTHIKDIFPTIYHFLVDKYPHLEYSEDTK
ncbi:MAG: FAD-dependent thymidylate synthase [Spirochaetia bacterium]|nr:FAD-dependent thymidylate synthase [Spirochaetia bacterium]